MKNIKDLNTLVITTKEKITNYYILKINWKIKREMTKEEIEEYKKFDKEFMKRVKKQDKKLWIKRNYI